MADIMAMKEISKVCNLVPIVGKSDLLNNSEREECRDKIAEVLSSENIEVFCLDSSGDERGGRPKSPFFVVAKSFGPNDTNDHKREYPWGVMLLDKPETNDFYFLVDSLVAKNLTNLVEATEVFYDDYRTKEIGQSLMVRSDGLGHDDKKLTKEIQKKIREDERTIMELRKRLVEKKKRYESRLLEMTGRCGNKAINSS